MKNAVKKEVLKFETVFLRDDDVLVIIDQTLLPNEEKNLELTEQKDIWDAIYKLQVRGAPAIGVAAAFAAYLASKEIIEEDFNSFYPEFKKKLDYINSSRPTAVNLSWALERMEKCALVNKDKPLDEIRAILRKEAIEIREEDIAVCRKIGEYGAELLSDGMGILTHCNAGALATVKYGTALAGIYVSMENGATDIRVYCDETRPLLQGARLSAFELVSAGADTTVICDNMASSIMKKGLIDIIFVGCDRVAANGDAANKIGTSGLAIIARHYGLPFYVCCPTSTIDIETKTGDDIHIEQRKPEEVTEMWYERRMAPKEAKVYNPAFDVTDNSLITGIITEFGILRPPYDEAIKRIMDEKNDRR